MKMETRIELRDTQTRIFGCVVSGVVLMLEPAFVPGYAPDALPKLWLSMDAALARRIAAELIENADRYDAENAETPDGFVAKDPSVF